MSLSRLLGLASSVYSAQWFIYSISRQLVLPHVCRLCIPQLRSGPKLRGLGSDSFFSFISVCDPTICFHFVTLFWTSSTSKPNTMQSGKRKGVKHRSYQEGSMTTHTVIYLKISRPLHTIGRQFRVKMRISLLEYLRDWRKKSNGRKDLSLPLSSQVSCVLAFNFFFWDEIKYLILWEVQ